MHKNFSEMNIVKIGYWAALIFFLPAFASLLFQHAIHSIFLFVFHFVSDRIFFFSFKNNIHQALIQENFCFWTKLRGETEKEWMKQVPVECIDTQYT